MATADLLLAVTLGSAYKETRMTPTEFKAWFDGFTDAVGDAPTPEQWKKIKAKVTEISKGEVTLPPPSGPWWQDPPGVSRSTGVVLTPERGLMVV